MSNRKEGMPETDIDDFYKVEHGENFVLSEEQTRKLIWQKFSRNLTLAEQFKERESRLSAD